ncbi:unnamed protein product [Protopolystoma xenopodis]|uniref:Uncharacterized protein n=1 Tax=Protopolystoma xenopodis TaxID=117903 RepID=A0A3S5A3T7_9PLAT|nr:unnamed protein product [Protopolystoma xenopodis]
MHQSKGTNYRTIAAAQLDLRMLLQDKSASNSTSASNLRCHGQVDFIGLVAPSFSNGSMLSGKEEEGTANDLVGQLVGRLTYWLRLCIPMEQAIRYVV